MIVGVDLGRHNTKIAYAKTEEESTVMLQMFRSCVKICNNRYDKDNTITIEGVKYQVGGTDNVNYMSKQDKSDDNVFHVCLLYALSYLNDTYFDIVLGYPLTHWNLHKNNMIKKYTNSSHTVTLASGEQKQITIGRCMVTKEGIYCLNKDDISANTLVIDIGGLTIDVGYFKNKKLVSIETSNLGVKKLCSDILADINKDNATSYTEEEIVDMLVNDDNYIVNSSDENESGEEIEFNLMPYKKQYLDTIIADLKTKIPAWQKCKKRFVGGGAVLLQELLLKRNCKVNNDAIYSNAKAFYQKGVSNFDQR